MNTEQTKTTDAIERSLKSDYKQKLKDFSYYAKILIELSIYCSAYEGANRQDASILISIDKIRTAIESVKIQINHLYKEGDK